MEAVMSYQDLYRELSIKVGTEHSQIVPEIWKTVSTPEEATLLNVLPATIEDLAQRFEKSQEAITGMLQVLFYKGLVFKVKREGKIVYHMHEH